MLAVPARTGNTWVGDVAQARARSRIMGPSSQSIAGCYPGRPFSTVAVVVVYSDAAYQGGIVAVAGYLGAFDEWNALFVPAWRGMLADPGWPTEVKEFKASDCRNGGGAFQDEMGWTAADRHRLMVEAVKVITATPVEMVGLGAAIELPPLLSHTALMAYERFAFFMCFQHLVQNALRVTGHRLPNDSDEVQFIFDEQKGYEGLAREMFRKARDSVPGVDVRHRVSDPLFGKSHKLIPLQAADLLAHETYKEVKNLREGRKLSGALRALVKGRAHYGDFIDAPTFALLERASREGTTAEITKDEFPGPRRLYDPHQPLRGDPGAAR